MLPTIIAGVGRDDEARDAVALGIALARARSARLLLAAVYVDVPSGPGTRASEDEARRAAQQGLDALASAVPADVACDTVAYASTSPVKGLRELAEREQALALVLGPTHLGTAALAVRGDVTLGALHGAPCAVAVAPAGYADRTPDVPRMLGVAWDGSTESDEALAEAVALAQRHRGRVRMFHVVERRDVSDMDAPAATYIAAQRHDTLMRLKEAATAAGLRVPLETMLLDGDPADLVKATRGLDLLVMGSRGYGPVKRAVLGSVSASLVHQASCPILVLPRGVRAALGG
jgi:nucleotide-binding universal stress UspA family protein